MKLKKEEIKQKLKSLGGWKYSDGSISKDFEFEDFKEALSFVNKVGDEAEGMNHHPNILIFDYKNVRVETSTHSEGGVTEKDIDFAKAIEVLN